MDSQDNGLLAMREAAAYLGVARNTARRLIAEKGLPTFATPLDRRRRLVRRGDLDRLRTPRPEQAAPRDEHREDER